MGIGRFLKSLVSPKAMAEEILRLQEEAYRVAERVYPCADPHVLLAQVWLSRMAAAGKVNPHDASVQQRAFEQTWQFSIMPWPRNARALGLYFLHEERPDLVHAFPEYMHEFNEILAPGLKTMPSGEFFTRYEETNPHLSYRPAPKTGTGWLFEPKAAAEASGGNEPASESADNLTVLGERIASTLSGYVSHAGTASLFNPETLIVLTNDNRVFISQASPDKLPFKTDIISYVAIKDLPAIDKCEELMGDGSHSGATFLAIDLLTRAILGKFVFHAD